MARDLPTYRENIRHRISEIRALGEGGTIGGLQEAVKDIKRELEQKDETVPPGAPGLPAVVMPQQVASLWSLPAALGPLFEPLATAALVVVMVVFMLLERQDLRNRFIQVLGHGRLTLTTKALDEAATRVSRYLLTQALVNAVFGLGVGIGLFLLGVPYPLLWASLAAALRFIPYVGPWIGAAAPVLVSLAVLEGWLRPLAVFGLFVVLELLTSMGLEPLLYAGAAGVSQVGLLVAIAFWTWLWGPAGLLMATPLTVCVVVFAKHFPGMELIGTLMSEAPAFKSDVTFYQRLLAQDAHEASDLIDQYVSAHEPDGVYDALFLPALSYARRDRAEDRLSAEEAREIHQMIRDLLPDVDVRQRQPAAEGPENDEARRVLVLGCAAIDGADELALTMFGQLLHGTPFVLEVSAANRLVSETVAVVKDGRYQAICVADIPPGWSSKARYLVKRLRLTMPDLKIIVGRWGAAIPDEERASFTAAGADYVATTLTESREQLYQLVHVMVRAPEPKLPDDDARDDLPASGATGA